MKAITRVRNRKRSNKTISGREGKASKCKARLKRRKAEQRKRRNKAAFTLQKKKLNKHCFQVAFGWQYLK